VSKTVPGAREVDPAKEVLRLVSDRDTPEHHGFRLVLDEVHQIQPDGQPPVQAHIVVTASKGVAAIPGLGEKIAAALREGWQPEGEE
jgi:hypothetical protein